MVSAKFGGGEEDGWCWSPVPITMQRYGKILKFNTKGVKNFSNLTIIKDLPTETAQIIIEMIITHEQHIYWHSTLTQSGIIFFYISTILQFYKLVF